ncbi:MAG: DUF99 family protein [Candidatus Nezhaarchaeota archaeon]|nr:DUF99 family protein [Candidatus Nezhaarchaeota archaeon]
MLGLEGGSLPRRFRLRGGRTALLGVLMRRFRIEGLAWRLIEVDGLDGSDKALEIAKELGGDIIMLGGVSYAGFNIVDPLRLFNELKKPVLVVVEDPPNNEAVRRALIKHFPDWEVRWRVFEGLALMTQVVKVDLPGGLHTYLEAVGMPIAEAERVVKELAKRGKTPEPLRTARLLVKGLSRSLLSILSSSCGEDG